MQELIPLVDNCQATRKYYDGQSWVFCTSIEQSCIFGGVGALHEDVNILLVAPAVVVYSSTTTPCTGQLLRANISVILGGCWKGIFKAESRGFGFAISTWHLDFNKSIMPLHD